MKWTILGLILLGVIAAGAAAMLAVAIQARNNGTVGKADPANEEVEILVANKNMPAMLIVEGDAVATKKIRRGEMPDKALTNTVQVVGQMLVTGVVAGQPFTEKQFANAESGMNLAGALKKGKRTMSVLLSSETGIENLLYPGCSVDVVASLRLPTKNEGSNNNTEAVSATILQNIQVLSAGARSIVDKEATSNSGDSKRGRMVTLKVTTKQAEMLQLAATSGTISVSMRNPLDTETQTIPGTRLVELNERLAELLTEIDKRPTGESPMTLPPASANTIDPATGATQPVVEIKAPVETRWNIEILRNGHLNETKSFPMGEAQGSRSR